MEFSQVSNWYKQNTIALFKEIERVGQQLENFIKGEKATPTAREFVFEISALAQLCHCFNLSQFERDILLLCVGIEIEPNFSYLCAEAQKHSPTQNYPTLALALAVFPHSSWSVLSPQNPLQYWQLIQIEPEITLTQSSLTIDPRILCYLLGEPATDNSLTGIIKPLSPQQNQLLPPSHRRLVEQLVDVWSNNQSINSYPVLQLSGSDQSTNYNIASATCEGLGFTLQCLSAEVLNPNFQEIAQLAKRWTREAILSHSVLLIDCDRYPLTDPKQKLILTHFLERIDTPVILNSNEKIIENLRPLIKFEVLPLSHQEQEILWSTHLGEAATELNGQIKKLATQFKVNSATIQAACYQYKHQNNNVKNSNSEQLWDFCRLHARTKLDDLAQLIHPTATWDDLVLPSKQRQILADIATHLRYKFTVYQEWGFAQKGDRNLGISALFYGVSGTGKTMAAEVLAQEFCLDLYRIDLSNVVSKYIGETEKNLRRIFDAAETGSAILLFDEADALFGKRTEVKDSHDRHANIEVSYLLQRMEAYQGLAILTSNLKNNLDQAFLRRLRFIIPFPFPETAERTEIWRRIFPQQTPIQDLDYSKLGQLKIAGGSIRNIALNAAFLAAKDHQAVTMNHIYQAAQQDYFKQEKLLTTEEIKGWEI